MIWNKAMECAERETMNQLQLHKLQSTVKRIYQNVDSYRDRMQEVGIKPGDIQSLDDLKHLPFCTKADLRDNYPYGMFSSPSVKSCESTLPVEQRENPRWWGTPETTWITGRNAWPELW